MWTLPRSLLKKFYQVLLNMRMQIAAGSDKRLHTLRPDCVEREKKITVLGQRKTKDKKVTLAWSITIFYLWFFYCLRTVIFSVSRDDCLNSFSLPDQNSSIYINMDTFICQRMNVLPFTSCSLLVGNFENDSMFFLLFTFFLFSFLFLFHNSAHNQDFLTQGISTLLTWIIRETPRIKKHSILWTPSLWVLRFVIRYYCSIF